MSEQGYRVPDVCKVIGISYRQLDYWARTGLVRPSIKDAQGSGTQRQYSFQDLVVLKVIKSLLDTGVSLQRVRKAVGQGVFAIAVDRVWTDLEGTLAKATKSGRKTATAGGS